MSGKKPGGVAPAEGERGGGKRRRRRKRRMEERIKGRKERWPVEL